jgi:hypothetical protein
MCTFQGLITRHFENVVKYFACHTSVEIKCYGGIAQYHLQAGIIFTGKIMIFFATIMYEALINNSCKLFPATAFPKIAAGL